ncbi:hypothetical protein WAE58_04470 [Pedobacter panaciterrae]|uniref:TerB family tellurite resistance protein n=1 Tax=Pedobacter panaciterrae TaxID=363849 RepID=A0ABU8NHD4_9SPHI
MEWNRRFFTGVALALACLISTIDVSGQTWAEFFQQKKTQKKYLLNQIAALQVYIGYARKGYELVDNGLQTVRDITSGEFSLHNAFIHSLKQVSPAVRNDSRVAEMISMQVSVLRLSGGWGDHELLSAGNRAYIAEVRSDLRDQCLNSLEELLLVITSGKLEMGEEERLRRIGELYTLMQEHYGFAREFTAQVNLLVRSRERKILELEQMEAHYE